MLQLRSTCRLERRRLAMKAVRFHEYGDPDVLRYEDVDAAGARRRARCASASPRRRSTRWTRASAVATCRRSSRWRCRTRRASTSPARWTRSARASRIAAVGDAVVGFLPMVADGASAEYVSRRPSSWPPAPTTHPARGRGRLPTVGLTAWQALFERRRGPGRAASARQRRRRGGRRLRGAAGQAGRGGGGRDGERAQRRARPGRRRRRDHRSHGDRAWPTRSPSRSTWCSTSRRSPRTSWPRWPRWSGRRGASLSTDRRHDPGR